jgi:hypothetical protein
MAPRPASTWSRVELTKKNPPTPGAIGGLCFVCCGTYDSAPLRLAGQIPVRISVPIKRVQRAMGSKEYK